jgi:AsmA family protein
MAAVIKFLLASFALGVLILTGVILCATGEQMRPAAEWGATLALGERVRIGRLAIERGQITTIEASDIVIDNPDWAGTAPMAELERFRLAFSPASIFGPRLLVPELTAANGRVQVARNEDGRLNWQGAEEVGDAAPDERDEFPRLDKLEVRDITLEYRDLPANRTETLQIAEVNGSAVPGKGIQMIGNGELRGQTVRLDAQGAGFDELIAAAEPYPVQVELKGPVDLALVGTFDQDNRADFDLRLAGEDLATLGELIGVPLPSTSPYSIKGAFLGEDRRFGLRGFSGFIGDSDASGEMFLDLRGKLPRLEGTIHSANLDFDDLAGLIGATPDVSESANAAQKREAAEDKLIPDTPIPADRLRTAELDIHLKADKVSSPVAQVESIDARFRLADGRLLVKPLTLGVSGGKVDGEVALNVREAVPSADVQLRLADVRLKDFFENTDFIQQMGGTVSGGLYFIGAGSALDQILANARGDGHVILEDGTISELLVEAAGVDVMETLGLLIGGDDAIAMPCAVAAIRGSDGKLQIMRGALSTTDSLIVTQGNLDLRARTVNMQIEGRAKDFSLIDLNVPVVVRGQIEDPNIRLGGFDPLPFFEVGDESETDCGELLAEAKRIAPGIPGEAPANQPALPPQLAETPARKPVQN